MRVASCVIIKRYCACVSKWVLRAIFTKIVIRGIKSNICVNQGHYTQNSTFLRNKSLNFFVTNMKHLFDIYIQKFIKIYSFLKRAQIFKKLVAKQAHDIYIYIYRHIYIYIQANIPERDSLYGVTQCATINHQFYYKFCYRIHIKRDSNIEYYKIYLF